MVNDLKDKKIILINAPPRAGKDTACNYLQDQIADMKHIKFSKIIKDRAHALYGLNVSTEHFEDVKDESREEFYGLSPRQVYINLSQMLMKPSHGDDIWVRQLIEDIITSENLQKYKYYCVSDLGFDIEIEKIYEIFGENILVLKVFKDGKNFDKDSREYVKLYDNDAQPLYKGIKSQNIYNKHSIETYQKLIYSVVKDFLNDENL